MRSNAQFWLRPRLIGLKTMRMEKGGMEKEERKIGLKMKFSLIWFREKTREKENGVENNPSKST